MSRRWRTIVNGGARTAALMSLVALIWLAGCAKQTQPGVIQPTPPQPQPETAPIEPPPVIPQPTQEDLAFEEAGRAAQDGDPARAVMLYESAASLSTNHDRLAEINFALGLLHSDPTSSARDLARGRIELQRVLDGPGDHPRVRDARVLAALLDELALLKAQSAEQRAESDELKGRLGALTEKLDQKEKELAEIKKILLQDKKKP